ncbi:MAG: hypothetical protein R3E79_20690 [Caldilineaceae bacterium]
MMTDEWYGYDAEGDVLDVSSVQTLPDSPFAVTHLQPPPPAVAALMPAVA